MTPVARVRRTRATKPDSLEPFERVVGAPATFEPYWGRAPLVRRDGGTFDDVMSLADVDAVVGAGARRPTIRMVTNGRTVDPTTYCTTTRLGGRDVDDTVDPRKVAARLEDGATLVLQSVHRIWPPAARFADAFAERASHAVQLNAYLTPAGAAGLAEHGDDHDVFALQVAGAKQWRVSGLGDVTLRAGDVLYLPAGCRHSAATATEFSFHLTLGVMATTYRAVIQRLLRSANDVELSSPLPLGYRYRSDAALTSGIEAAFGRAAVVLRDGSVGEVIEQERERFRPAYDGRGRITGTLLADEIDGDTVLEWITRPPRLNWIDDARQCRVVMGDVVLRVPASVVAAIECLTKSRSMMVDDLPGLDAGSCLVLARRLLRIGACRVLV